VVVALAGVGFAATNLLGSRDSSPPASTHVVSKAVPDAPPAAASRDVVQVAGDDVAVDAGATPMAQRVATIGLLNKRNGVGRDVTMKPGQAIRVGDVVIRLRACEHTAPWEPEQLTGGFVQLDVRGIDGHWRRAFSGWLYKERPALNVVQHPIYDVWPKSCTMSFPDKGPDTDVLAAPSTARKSAPAASQDRAPSAEAPSTSTSASPSNAM
jgi:hypothetical protein